MIWYTCLSMSLAVREPRAVLYHARQLKLLCTKYRSSTQPRAKRKKKREEKLSTGS